MKKLFILLISLILFGTLLSNVDINLAQRSDIQLYFNSYDNKVNDEQACFNVVILPHSDFTVEVNGDNIILEGQCVDNSYLLQGDNIIRIRSSNQSIFFHVSKSDLNNKSTVYLNQVPDTGDKPNNVLFVIVTSFLIFLLPGILITSKFFSIDEPVDFISLSMAFSITAVVIISWALDLFDFFNQTFLILSLTLLLLFVFLFKRKQKFKFPKAHSKRIYYVVIFFILLTIFSQFFFYSHNSPWSVYYERQSETAYEDSGLPEYDNLSYLGRPFTFVPGYILLKSSHSLLSFTHPQNTFFVFQVLGNLFLISSILFFSRSMKFNLREAAIVAMFLYSSMFIFGWTTISLLHMFAFSLFLLSVGLALRGSYLSSLFAGISCVFHASFLIGFPVVLFILQKKTDFESIKKLFSFTALAVIIFIILYSPVLIENGLPNEIQSENWGYLIRGNIINLGTMTAGFMSLAVIPAIFYGYRKKSNRKLAISMIVLIALFLGVSYRLNVFLAVVAASLFVSVFGDKIWHWKIWKKVLILLFVASIAFNIYLYQGESLSTPIIQPFMHLNSISNPSDRVLVEPFFGHITAYFAQRPSLTDLYVEYASNEKYTDTLDYIEDGDIAILEKWNIAYTMTLRNSRILKVDRFIYTEDELEYTELDKIYTNIWFNIHKRT